MSAHFDTFVLKFLLDHEWGLGGGWHVAQCHECLGAKDRGHRRACLLAEALMALGDGGVRWDDSEQVSVQDSPR